MIQKVILTILFALLYFSLTAQSNNPGTKENTKKAFEAIVTGSWDEADDLLAVLWEDVLEQSDKKGEAKLSEVQGVYYEIRGELDSAEIYYIRSGNLYKAFSDKEGYFSVLTNMALLYKKKGDYSKSIEFSNRSLELAESLDDIIFAAKAHHNLSITLRKNNDFDGAIDHAFEALEIFEVLGDSMYIISAKNGIGILYEQLKNYKKAELYYVEVYSFAERRSNSSLLAAVLGNMSSVYRKLDNEKKAIYYDLKSLEIEKKRENPEGMCLSYIGLGHAYFTLEKMDSAKYFYKKARAVSEKHGYYSLEIQVLTDIARVLTKEKRFASANKLLSQTERIIRKNSLDALILPYLEDRKNLYLEQEDYENAALYYDSLILYQEELLLEKLNDKLDQGEIDVEILKLKKEREAILKESDSRRRSLIFLVFGGFVIALFIVIVVFRWVKKKNKKTGKELEQIKFQLSSGRKKYKEKINSIRTPKDVSNLDKYFLEELIQLFPKLESELIKKFPEEKFPSRDLKICALHLLDCPNQTAAWILNLSDSAYGMARKRLRGRLNVPHDKNIKPLLEIILN